MRSKTGLLFRKVRMMAANIYERIVFAANVDTNGIRAIFNMKLMDKKWNEFLLL